MVSTEVSMSAMFNLYAEVPKQVLRIRNHRQNEWYAYKARLVGSGGFPIKKLENADVKTKVETKRIF